MNWCYSLWCKIEKNRREAITVALLFFVAFVLFGNYLQKTISSHHLDTAFLLELADRSYEEQEANSRVLRVAVDGSKTWNKLPEDVCSSNLLPSSGDYNVMDNHAYYAIYPISLLSKIFSADYVLSYLHAFSFIFLLIVPYFFLRSNNVSMFLSATFSLLVSMHYAWSYSLSGDYYMDRMYMPFALLYITGMYHVLSNKRSHSLIFITTVLIFGIIAASMTERASIMIGMSTLSVLFLCWEKISSNKVRLIVGSLAILFLAYAYWYVSYRFVGVEGGGSLGGISFSFSHLIDRLMSDNYSNKFFSFLVVNIGCLGFLSLFAGFRAAAIALAVLVPNVIVTIGGAELVGWTTHYHSMYFPVLIFVSMIGYLSLLKSEWLKTKKIYKVSLLAIPLVSYVIINPYTGKFHSPSSENYNYSIHSKVFMYYASSSSSNEHMFNINDKRLNSIIPKGVNVSIPEGVMPSLYHDRNISYYPLGINVADYTVLNLVYDSVGGMYYKGVVSYKGIEATEQLDKCITKKLSTLGFDVMSPLVIGSMQVLSRMNEDRKYSDELLKNSNLVSDLEFWSVYGDIRSTGNANVSVNSSNFLSQLVDIKGDKIYRLGLIASCLSKNVFFRMQVNWLDEDGVFIFTDILPRMCDESSNMYVTDFISPDNAYQAIIYIVGTAGEFVDVEKASFKQRL